MTEALSLLLSIVIEAIVASGAIRISGWGNGSCAALAAAIGTLMTHPVVWRSVPALEPQMGYSLALALAEGGTVLAESIAYRLIVPLRWPSALAISLVANAASAAAGLAWFAVTA